MVRVFLCHVDEVKEKSMERGLSLLPKQEAERILQLKNEKQRCLSLAGKLLLQKVLQERGYSLADCIVQKNGKPELKGTEDFHFNLSHSGEYVLLATSSLPIGADIERIRERLPKGLVRILSKEEEEILESLPKQEQPALFFRFWTRKESFVKAIGGRIFVKPFLLSMVEKGQLVERYEDFHFYDFPINGYALSLCSKECVYAEKMQFFSFSNLLSV